jgi:hypothetical protein
MEVEVEIETEVVCPKCGHKFKHLEVRPIEVEPPEYEEDYDRQSKRAFRSV